MRRQPVRVGMLVCASWALAACGPAAAPHPITADPRSLVISLADLPGWKIDGTNSGAINDPRKMLGDSSDISPYTDNGWVRAYEADFLSLSTIEAQSVSVLVSVFGDPAGAQSFFTHGIGGQDPGGQPISHAPPLGLRSKVFREQVGTSADSNGTIWYWFYWQDRNVVARVLVKGPRTAEGDGVSIALREAHILQQH